MNRGYIAITLDDRVIHLKEAKITLAEAKKQFNMELVECPIPHLGEKPEAWPTAGRWIYLLSENFQTASNAVHMILSMGWKNKS